MKARPSFIRSTRDVPEKAHVYPQSTEKMGPVRKVGKEAGEIVNVQTPGGVKRYEILDVRYE